MGQCVIHKRAERKQHCGKTMSWSYTAKADRHEGGSAMCTRRLTWMAVGGTEGLTEGCGVVHLCSGVVRILPL